MGVSGLPADHDLYARAALPSYGRAPDAPIRLLSLSENATYLVDDGDPLVLRVHRADYHSLDAVRSELAWMAALREQTDVVTPQLIPARYRKQADDWMIAATGCREGRILRGQPFLKPLDEIEGQERTVGRHAEHPAGLRLMAGDMVHTGEQAGERSRMVRRYVRHDRQVHAEPRRITIRVQ